MQRVSKPKILTALMEPGSGTWLSVGLSVLRLQMRFLKQRKLGADDLSGCDQTHLILLLQSNCPQ